MEKLINAIADLDEEKTLKLVQEKINAGESALNIVEQCRMGVEIVGERYGKEEYYLSDLIMSEEIFQRVMEILAPNFPIQTQNNGLKIVMGTIEGDIHDLGKNIIIYLLKSHGVEVYDLGVDVKSETFVKSLKETGASVLGISVLVTSSISAVREVVDLIKEEGLRDQVKIIIGGYPVDEYTKEYTGADFYEKDAIKAVELVKSVLK